MIFKKNDQRKKILVVDDDPVQMKLLESRLTENGYQVIAVSEAAQGLQIAIDQNPHVIILDVMMPIINGYNFCRLLKSEEGWKEVPVIFLTSRDDDDDKKIGREMGANAYLTKPVNMSLLLETIQKLVEA